MSVKAEIKPSHPAQDITVPKLKKKAIIDVSSDMTVPVLKRSRKIKLPSYEDVEMVTGIFRHLEYPGTGITIPFRGGWKGPIRKYPFFDGETYKIPKELAEHLNQNCAYKTLKWVSSDGKETVNARPVTSPSMPNYKQVVDKKTHRFLFQITG